MVSPVVAVLLLACSVQLSSSIQVPKDSVQDLYGIASRYPECTSIYLRRLRHTRGIVSAVRSACRKDEDTFRAALNYLQCSDITTAVSHYCRRKYLRFRLTGMVCRFARAVKERCEESDYRSPLCKLAMTRMPRRWASITCERYESYCKSSRSRHRYHVRFLCRPTKQFYTQCCGDSPRAEPARTRPEPTTATTEPDTAPPTTTEVPKTEPPTTTTATTTTPTTNTTTTEVPTSKPPTTQPTTTPSGPSLPEVASNTFLTACQQQCVRNDLIGSLCTGGTSSEECNNLQPPATSGSYTCCSG